MPLMPLTGAAPPIFIVQSPITIISNDRRTTCPQSLNAESPKAIRRSNAIGIDKPTMNRKMGKITSGTVMKSILPVVSLFASPFGSVLASTSGGNVPFSGHGSSTRYNRFTVISSMWYKNQGAYLTP